MAHYVSVSVGNKVLLLTIASTLSAKKCAWESVFNRQILQITAKKKKNDAMIE